MIRHIRRASVLIAFCVHTSAAMAYAELRVGAVVE